ncbi:MAG: glycosyltransferase [Candidatus Didemnitutus sp.]|nr:glycosyltransferase [Candidatus Didemnitutus sp.]
MIYFDVTKTGEATHRSGLTRVSARLLAELGDAAVPVTWSGWRRRFVAADGRRLAVQPDDWWFTVELFSAAERRGFADFVARPPCRLAAMFHDAIPLRFPAITWPQSVKRHPDYMTLLAGFDRVEAISEASRGELAAFWQEHALPVRAQLGTIALGADFDRAPRAVAAEHASARPALLCVGIVEPRKNQGLLLDAAEALWRAGVDFDLHVVGRVNPHFGAPIERRLRETARAEPRLVWHGAADDAVLQRLYREVTAVAFPTLAEGCGLPLLEALWRGTPCVCSDLPVLRENADGGGCVTARVNDVGDWCDQLRRVLTDPTAGRRLRAEAAARPLPTWAETAQVLRARLV